MTEQERISQPARVIVGHCPDCRNVLVVANEYEVWPWVRCSCGWGGDTQAIENRARYERGGVVIDVYSPDVTA